MGKLEIEREADIREQHKEFLREVVYDGHNRHSGITTIQDFRNRRYRRLWNYRMREAVFGWNNRNSPAKLF